MDILKARKKAAERKQARKKKEPGEALAAEPMQVEPAPAVEAAPAPAAEAPVPEPIVLPASEAAEAHVDEIELLSFRLGVEAYAIPVKDAREVLKVRSLTPVPNAPPHIIGVTSLRGAVLPVIDLCARLGIVPGVRDEKSRIIVVNTDDEDVGLVVDRVTGVLRITPDAIKPAPDHIEQGAAFLSGIVRKEDKLYVLLDLEKAVEV